MLAEAASIGEPYPSWLEARSPISAGMPGLSLFGKLGRHGLSGHQVAHDQRRVLQCGANYFGGLDDAGTKFFLFTLELGMPSIKWACRTGGLIRPEEV